MTYKVKDIADFCGVTTRYVYKRAEKLGIEKQGKHWVFDEDAAARLIKEICPDIKSEPLSELSEPFAEQGKSSKCPLEQPQVEAPKKVNRRKVHESDSKVLFELIQTVQKQLEVKDAQIEGYKKVISDLMKAQEQDKEEIKELRQQVRALIGNVSLLNAADKRDLLTQGDTQEQAEVIEVKQAQEQQIQEHEIRSMTRWEHLRAFITGK